jgi:hypothetical protein
MIYCVTPAGLLALEDPSKDQYFLTSREKLQQLIDAAERLGPLIASSRSAQARHRSAGAPNSCESYSY